jgi:hypothetical protein
LELVEPKTTRSRRAITMPVTVTEALREHRVRQVKEQLLAGSRWVESDFIFTTATGTPLEGPAITKRFQKLLAAPGCHG